MNNDENSNKSKDNDIHVFKSLHIVKLNFPTSNLFYIIMFLLKYIGIIVNSRIIEMVQNKEHTSINKYLSNFLIFGKNFVGNIEHYNALTMIGAILLIFYFVLLLSGISYMKFKYKNINSLLDEKSHKVNEKLENIIFKILSKMLLVIIFFHQYILEYYFFSVYGFIYYAMGLFSKNGQFSSIYVDTLHYDLYSYFSNHYNLSVFIINLIVIIMIFYLFFFFLSFNTVKCLFLSSGIYSGNFQYLIMKIIILSLQPFYGIINLYNDQYKIIIGIIFNGVIIFICFLSFWSCLFKFGYYPTIVSNISLFIEIFVFVTSITEIIFYFSGSRANVIFFLIKLFIQLINSYFLMQIFLYLKDKHNSYEFSNNLFSKNYSDLSKGGLYYYMQIYLEYQKDKTNKYLKLFRLYLSHIKSCKKIDCPGLLLIPKEYLKSPFVPITMKKYESEKDLIKRNDSIETNENEESILDDKNHYNLGNNKQVLGKDKKDKKDNKIVEKKDLNINEVNNNDKIYNKKSRNNNNNNETIICEQKRLSDIQFQIIFEQEIINKIDYLYKMRKYCPLEDYIFLHIQYLLMMKQNYSLALYFIGKYEKCGIKWSFMTKFYLYEYKKLLLTIFFNKTNLNNVDESTNKFRKDNISMTRLIDYFTFSAILQNLIISSCNKLKILFTFRKDMHIPIILRSFNNSKINKFYKTGEGLKNNIDKILKFLKYSVNNLTNQGISADLSYIVSNFFIFINNKIPNDLRKIINPVFDINIIADRLESGYKFLNIAHPLILALTKNNSFKIKYFSSVINNRLGYYKYELMRKDFHEKLFPGIRFNKQHEILMKTFLFSDDNSLVKNNTFLRTKEGYLQGINFTAKKFPSFYVDFYMIVGIDFTDDLFLSQINQSFNRYSFMLDENLEFISQTKNFYQDFEFNIYMFKEIKINFFDFFCVDKNKFNEKLKKKNFTKLKKSVNNVYNLKKEEDAFILFKTIAYEKAYELRTIPKKIKSITKEFITINDKISKDKIIKMIPQFSKLIEEYGLDFEWYQHFENLTDRLTIREFKKEDDDFTEYSKNMLTLGMSPTFRKSNKYTIITNNSSKTNNILITKNYNKDKDKDKDNLMEINENNESIGRHSNSSFSLASKRNNNEDNYTKKILQDNNLNLKIVLDRNFDVVYSLRKLGTVYYYLVDLYEKTYYKKSYDNSSILELKQRSSIKMKDESLKIQEKLNFDNDNGNDNNNDIGNDNTKFIKAKTLFSSKYKNNPNFPGIHFEPVNNILVEEDSNLGDEPNEIEPNKSWTSEKNNIYIQKHLIKEGERIFNNKDEIIVSDQNKKGKEKEQQVIINGSSVNNKLSSFNITKISKKERQTKKMETKMKIKERVEYSNKTNYNSRTNKKDDDDEKMSFITSDKLEEYINQSYVFNKYYIIIIVILYIITILLITIKIIFAISNFSFTSYLTIGMIILQQIKTDIYMGSIITLSQCYRFKPEDQPSTFNSYEMQLTIKSADLMDHINGFEKQLKLAHNAKLLSNIMNYLYKNITSYHLNDDWTQTPDETYLLKEINFFSYLLNKQATQDPNNIICNFENNFYLLFFNSTEEIYNLNNKENASFNQKVIYYILMNIIYIINPLLSDIIEEIIIVQVNTMISYLIKVMIISIIIAFIIIVNEILILLKNRLDINFIKEIFVFLYHYEKNQFIFEYEINYLDITAKEFNINNLILLENIKKANYDEIQSNPRTSKDLLFNEIINNDENNNKNMKESLISNSIRNNKNASTKLIDNFISKNPKNGNEIEQFSIGGSYLNNSMNNNSSLLQLINNKKDKDAMNKLKADKKSKSNERKNKSKKKLKNEINNNAIINEDENMFYENEDTLDILKNTNTIIPFSVTLSIMLSLLLSFLFLLIIILNISDIYKKRNIWEYAINLSMNYLDKIPRVLELFFSTFLSIIIGRLDVGVYYKKEEYQDYQQRFLTYFTQFKNYEKSELISSSLKDSLFANKLYDNYRIKKNIEFGENDKFFKGYFTQTRIWNKKLNEKELFCINSALGAVLFYNKWISTLDTYFSYADIISNSCTDENEKINESGLDLEIDLILHEITYLYIDFEGRMDIDIKDARKQFFENGNFIRMLKDMNIPFTLAEGSIYSAIYTDMNNLNEYISFFEIIFINITFLINFVILAFLIIIFIVNEKCKKILVFISKIFKKNSY